MSFEVITTVEPDRLVVTVHGVYSFDKLFGFIDLIQSEADNAGRQKVLIDCSRMEGKMTEVDRFEGGQYIARVFGSRIHAVLVMPEGQVTKLDEIAAVNRGAIFFVTDSMEEAERWLRSLRY
jgi:hypothetical protein